MSAFIIDAGFIKWKKGADMQLSEHFNTKEFECPCDKCSDQKISRNLLSKLEHVRHDFGEPMKVSSGYRCPAHNVEVGGAKQSPHMDGIAADVMPVHACVDSLDKLYDLCYSEFDNIGNGRNHGFIHVDDRQPKPNGKRLWLYP